MGARIVFSAIVLVFAVWLIGSKGFEDSAEKLAFGAIGLILGYWLK